MMKGMSMSSKTQLFFDYEIILLTELREVIVETLLPDQPLQRS